MFIPPPKFENLKNPNDNEQSTLNAKIIESKDKEILELEREVNRLKHEIKSSNRAKTVWKQKYLVAKGEKKIIRQVDLTRMMRLDSNLNRMVIETTLSAKRWWGQLSVKPETLKTCPITNETILLLSMYQRKQYEDKENGLKKHYHFKETPFY